MKHLFVTTAKQLQPRWQAAFADAHIVAPDTVTPSGTEVDGVVWLVRDARGEYDWQIVNVFSRHCCVVLLSPIPDHREALQALQNGARGYAHVLSPVETLKQIATVVTHRGIWVPADLMANVMGNTWQALNGEQRLDEVMLAKLTPRERDVALAVVRGSSNKQVARDLDITERTVKAHLSAIFQKLDITDRLQLVLKLTGSKATLGTVLS
jgi:DNA-binding NarL/FixJ family response regulator